MIIVEKEYIVKYRWDKKLPLQIYESYLYRDETSETNHIIQTPLPCCSCVVLYHTRHNPSPIVNQRLRAPYRTPKHKQKTPSFSYKQYLVKHYTPPSRSKTISTCLTGCNSTAGRHILPSPPNSSASPPSLSTLYPSHRFHRLPAKPA